MIESDSLRLAESDYRQAAERAEELRRLRNELVQQAIAEGWTQARIAGAMNLTRARVGQLALAKA
jgi:hypothetical protein